MCYLVDLRLRRCESITTTMSQGRAAATDRPFQLRAANRKMIQKKKEKKRKEKKLKWRGKQNGRARRRCARPRKKNNNGRCLNSRPPFQIRPAGECGVSFCFFFKFLPSFTLTGVADESRRLRTGLEGFYRFPTGFEVGFIVFLGTSPAELELCLFFQ